MRRLASLLLPLLLLSSCGSKTATAPSESGDTIPMKYASLLTMVRYHDHVNIKISDPWHQGKTLHEYNISQPKRKAIVFTTSHAQLLYWLGAAESIRGVCDLQYMLIPDIHRRVKEGSVLDCGNGMQPMKEMIASSGADALLVSPFENSGGYGGLEKLGIDIIEAADYMETSALARAEWMKFYGIVFGREREADSLFNVVDSAYCALRQYAGQLPKGRSMLTERKTGSVWYCPGGRSSVGQLLKDAHAGYDFAADSHSGSLALPFEEVLAKAGESDVWAFKYNGEHSLSRQDLLSEFHGYAALKAFRTGEIYECNTLRTPYFEIVGFRPDLLLREFIQIAHPETDLGGLKFYQKLE